MPVIATRHHQSASCSWSWPGHDQDRGYAFQVFWATDGDLHLQIMPDPGRVDMVRMAPCLSARLRIRMPLIGGGAHPDLYDGLTHALHRAMGRPTVRDDLRHLARQVHALPSISHEIRDRLDVLIQGKAASHSPHGDTDASSTTVTWGCDDEPRGFILRAVRADDDVITLTIMPHADHPLGDAYAVCAEASVHVRPGSSHDRGLHEGLAMAMTMAQNGIHPDQPVKQLLAEIVRSDMVDEPMIRRIEDLIGPVYEDDESP